MPQLTEPIPPTETPYENSDIKNNVAPELTKKAGVLVWEPHIEEPIPYNVLDIVSKMSNATYSPLGFLAFAGYVDYSLALKVDDGDDGVVAKKRTQITNEDVQSATSKFLKFNGFVENGEITDEMIDFMKKDRCGNPDVTIDENLNRECQVLDKRQIGKAIRHDVPGLQFRSDSKFKPGARWKVFYMPRKLLSAYT